MSVGRGVHFLLPLNLFASYYFPLTFFLPAELWFLKLSLIACGYQRVKINEKSHCCYFKRYSSRDSPQVLLSCWPSTMPGSRNYDLMYSCRVDPRNAGTAVNWQICGSRDINASSSCRVSSGCRTRICKYYREK